MPAGTARGGAGLDGPDLNSEALRVENQGKIDADEWLKKVTTMSAVFAQRVVVDQGGEHGKGMIKVEDARLKPGDLVEIAIHPVPTRESTGALLNQTRALALDLPPDYSTSFESRL